VGLGRWVEVGWGGVGWGRVGWGGVGWDGVVWVGGRRGYLIKLPHDGIVKAAATAEVGRERVACSMVTVLVLTSFLGVHGPSHR
jgi:hypothetical protein